MLSFSQEPRFPVYAAVICLISLTKESIQHSSEAAEPGYCTKESSCADGSRSCGRKNLQEKPNILIILADDLGYGDLASYGSPSQEWGPIDQMASEGRRFSNAYSADSLCTPSRTGLLTGRLPIRSGMVGGKRVLFCNDTGGLPKDELTLAEALKLAGYHTGMTGKWHLGINEHNHSDGSHLPDKHGFDWVGINLPFTNLWECDESGVFMKNGPAAKLCFLYNGTRIIQQPILHENLTKLLVEDFEQFLKIHRNNNKPFFFYFSNPHVHTSLFADSPFRGKSNRGLFGDNLNELSWAVGRVLQILKTQGLDRKTLVVFLSDHGPHKEICQLGGEVAGFKGGKGTSFEGGYRIPFVVWWPGTIAAASFSSSVISSLDLFPTLLELANAQLPPNRVYDGVSVVDLLLGCSEAEKKRPIYFYCNRHLMAVRHGPYKLHYYTLPVLPAGDNDTDLYCPGGVPLRDWYYANLTCPDEDLTSHDPPLVYDLGHDPFERYSLNTSQPAIVELIATVNKIILDHKRSIEPVPEQMGHFADAVNPCCDPPKCRC